MVFKYSRATSSLERSHSFFNLSGIPYKPAEGSFVGRGQTGKVHRFVSHCQIDRIVKKPHKGNASLDDGRKELEYYRLVYPELEVYLDSTMENDYRLIMPDLGHCLCDYLEYATNEETIHILVGVVEELIRIHALGITHYDIQARNILIDKNGKIRFIDGVTFEKRRTTQKDDITQLIRLLSAYLTERNLSFHLSELPSLYEIKTALSNCEVRHLSRLFFSSPPKRLGITCGIHLATLNKAIQYLPVSASIKLLAKGVSDAIKDAVLSDQLQAQDVIRVCQQTQKLISDERSNDTIQCYFDLAKDLHSKGEAKCRKLSKTMCALAVPALIATIAIPGINIIAPIAIAVTFCVFAALILGTRKSSLQNTMENLALEHIDSKLDYGIKRASLCMS